jgi:hypothetical protein
VRNATADQGGRLRVPQRVEAAEHLSDASDHPDAKTLCDQRSRGFLRGESIEMTALKDEDYQGFGQDDH